eukprot:m.99837 g.99837  ORF g.99837 m.99837 type:complete len:246 (-) comp15604_c1_seq1:913-1650(-)
MAAARGSRTWGELIGATVQEAKRRLQPVSLSQKSKQVLHRFDNQAALDSWMVNTDKAIGGYSQGSLSYNPNSQSAVFKGVLSTKLPANSRVKQSGFCLARSLPLPSTLLGNRFYDLQEFSGLELQLRGDGRNYILSVQTDSMQPEDLFQAFIYTKGGPHWQRVQIPFQDFLLTNMGFVQNEQTLMNTSKIKTIGLLLADGIDGPFQLELQEISAITMRKLLSQMDVQPPATSTTSNNDATSSSQR